VFPVVPVVVAAFPVVVLVLVVLEIRLALRHHKAITEALRLLRQMLTVAEEVVVHLP
jgi:hypothetical protein